jgi:excisionase family DNA binding protein
MPGKTAKAFFVPQKHCYSIAEAAKFLGVGQTSIRELIKRGLLRKSKVLRRAIIPGADVETLIERTCSRPLRN